MHDNDEEEIILYGVKDTITVNDETVDLIDATLADYLWPRLKLATCPKAIAGRPGELCAGPDCTDCVLRRTMLALYEGSIALLNVNAALKHITRDRDEEPAVTEDVTDRGRTRTCAGCGRKFTGVRADSRYCSNACRQRAYRQKHNR